MPSYPTDNPDPSIYDVPHPDDFDDQDCWQCGGEGYVANCQDEIGCVDPESGCDFCTRRCSVCNPRKATPTP